MNFLLCRYIYIKDNKIIIKNIKMKIKKNGKVVTLTESDLNRIVKRTLNEASYADMVNNDEGNVDLPKECSKEHVDEFMKFMSEVNGYKFKIQTGTDYGITDSFAGKILILSNTQKEPKVCGCTKANFFE